MIRYFPTKIKIVEDTFSVLQLRHSFAREL